MVTRKRRIGRRTSKAEKPLTPFGVWLAAQSRGAPTRAMLATGLAYTTVLAAKTRLVTSEVAELLSEFTGGAVAICDIEKPRRRARNVAA